MSNVRGTKQLQQQQAVDLVISFDTTSSMHAVLGAARRDLGPLLRSLFSASRNLRVGLILHGDYGDLYETKLVQPTDNVDALTAFMAEAPDTCGLDYPECYELVLHQAATKVRWRHQAADGKVARMLVMMGDAVPHEPNSKRNKYRLDWRKEARCLAGMGVAVYCVDCGGVGTGFYGFASELCDICSGATVPYRGCNGLQRLLRRLLTGATQDLNRLYQNYHKDSRGAETAPTSLSMSPASATSSRTAAEATKTVTATQARPVKLRPSDVALAVARGGGVALGKTAHLAGRLLVYIGLSYLMYIVCVATCL